MDQLEELLQEGGKILDISDGFYIIGLPNNEQKVFYDLKTKQIRPYIEQDETEIYND